MALVSYVKKLNIPSGVVGACRLDLAYEHFKVLLVLCNVIMMRLFRHGKACRFMFLIMEF